MSAPTFFQSGNSSRVPPPARYHENVTARLNLAALTAEELQALLGENAAQAKWPDLSRARLEQRPLPGPEVPRDFRAEPQEERVWVELYPRILRLALIAAKQSPPYSRMRSGKRGA